MSVNELSDFFWLVFRWFGFNILFQIQLFFFVKMNTTPTIE